MAGDEFDLVFRLTQLATEGKEQNRERQANETTGPYVAEDWRRESSRHRMSGRGAQRMRLLCEMFRRSSSVPIHCGR